ncbi:hypothetical protein QLX67_05680 [Balneolaceae bacterium ANBcel3]|nr:hypothetical protein [Balneolaceae bacterium ANBcel3]
MHKFIEREKYKGYDPYDILNAHINFLLFGKWGPPVATQIQKRLPINLRPLLGIKKERNPKGMGLFLKAYCNLYKATEKKEYLDQAHWLFKWLMDNNSKGYSGLSWGYNFPWATPKEFKEAYLPSVVVTSAVIDGIYEYYLLTGNKEAKQAIISASEYVKKDIPITNLEDGISFAYTHISKVVCYNASLHATEILAKAAYANDQSASPEIKDAVSLVLSRQKPNGSWYYSEDPETGAERKQIDFHQGFILVSLQNIVNLTGYLENEAEAAIRKGTAFYKEEQFEENGRSLWRLPSRWPTDIHHQSQGIITFSLLKDYDESYLPFAHTIAQWTIENMQDQSGYFYYRKYPFFTNKIPYIRWGQAWMLLALSELYRNN